MEHLDKEAELNQKEEADMIEKLSQGKLTVAKLVSNGEELA